MNILVTAGNTQTDIDRVRCLTNVFSGRTGANIAHEAAARGHEVLLLTSQAEHAEQVRETNVPRFSSRLFRTFSEFCNVLERQIKSGAFDAVVHAAAVSDYLVESVWTPAEGATFEKQAGRWQSREFAPELEPIADGKIKSTHRELWVRLVPAPKLVDYFRLPWGFDGVIVKFKLEVNVTEEELVGIAESARGQSQADLIVANTLENKSAWAILGPIDKKYVKVERAQLPARLLDEIEMRHLRRGNEHAEP